MKLLRLLLTCVAYDLVATTAAAEETSAPDACTTLIEQAAREQRDGRLVAARSHLGECRAEICTPEQRAECARRADDLAHAVPTVAFTVRDAAGHDLDGRVTLDDSEARIPLGRALPIDPGVHEVRWSVPTGAWGTQRITVVEGEKLRLVPIVVPPSSGGGAGSAAPWIIVAAGATLMVTSAVFQLVAINEDSDSKNLELAATRSDLSPAESRAVMDSARSHHDAAKTDQAIAIATGIVGVGAVAAGVTWALLRERGTTTTGLRPAVGPAFAGLSFGRSF